jgi:hypothetical protein
MRKVWKWVIGIVVVLVVVAAVVGGAFLLRNHFANVAYATRLNRPGVQVPGDDYRQRLHGPFPGMRPYGNDGWGGYGMHMRGPGMMGFGWMFPLGGLIGGLFSLGLLALVVLGIVWLVSRLRRPMPVATPVTPVEPVAPATSMAAVHPCPRCGEPVQEGWKHCPNCGKRQ